MADHLERCRRAVLDFGPSPVYDQGPIGERLPAGYPYGETGALERGQRSIMTNLSDVAAPRVSPATRELEVWPGQPAPLGATCVHDGVNFALFSEHATKVELCLFRSADATEESHRISLPERTHQVW